MRDMCYLSRGKEPLYIVLPGTRLFDAFFCLVDGKGVVSLVPSDLFDWTQSNVSTGFAGDGSPRALRLRLDVET